MSATRRRGRPAGQSGEETRRAILATALRLFGEAGYDAVSMDALAEACGLNARALYYHFASKRDLFAAASEEAFRRFGDEVLARVFVHASVAARVEGYVDVYRALHASDPDVLPFIGRILVETLSGGPGEGELAVPAAAAPELPRLMEVVVDDAIAAGEVHPDLDRDGALLLLSAVGMGLALASLRNTGAYPAMLDALDLLNAGTLFTPDPRD